MQVLSVISRACDTCRKGSELEPSCHSRGIPDDELSPAPSFRPKQRLQKRNASPAAERGEASERLAADGHRPHPDTFSPCNDVEEVMAFTTYSGAGPRVAGIERCPASSRNDVVDALALADGVEVVVSVEDEVDASAAEEWRKRFPERRRGAVVTG